MDDIRKINRKIHQNLSNLLVFRLAAENGNFTKAAEALGLTQSSVSQSIKALELDLGIALFKREHRGVALTNEGLRLLNVVSPALERIRTAYGSQLDRSKNARVRISADFAFSTYWLMPRLSQLRAELGEDVEIQILASQVHSDDCDITIHVNDLSKMKKGDKLLLEEKVAAVCSPEFLAIHGPINAANDLLNLQLLSLSRPVLADWQTWQGWFANLGFQDDRTHNFIGFNNYDMLIQAAVSGEGIALGWLGLVDRLIRQKLLVFATNDIVSSNAGYVMSRNYNAQQQSPKVVFDWISKQIDSETMR
ncbi:Glycine cleavage system transcriptional activator [Roseovarius albus]|uniref:Glycine cleavage system transcriptional activator n=1 Tax=Roseovarius albus TaxID=1247867 RepID=A0A1X7A6Q5_9RHOB|nr:LysR family transcriptional regulator [Roseovarius albus]SLN70274.1 Glycine cleavage system transcriptional activator [Roseovarius albus]